MYKRQTLMTHIFFICAPPYQQSSVCILTRETVLWTWRTMSRKKCMNLPTGCVAMFFVVQRVCVSVAATGKLPPSPPELLLSPHMGDCHTTPSNVQTFTKTHEILDRLAIIGGQEGTCLLSWRFFWLHYFSIIYSSVYQDHSIQQVKN